MNQNEYNFIFCQKKSKRLINYLYKFKRAKVKIKNILNFVTCFIIIAELVEPTFFFFFKSVSYFKENMPLNGLFINLTIYDKILTNVFLLNF